MHAALFVLNQAPAQQAQQAQQALAVIPNTGESEV
jgi:hypothetical protein